MRRPRVIVAPDSFKGTLTAVEVADAIGDGVTSAGGFATLCPLSDGGEGLTSVVAQILGGSRHSQIVPGPIGEEVVAEYLISPDGATAVVDAASACGLPLAIASPRNAELSSSAGVGRLVAAAIRCGVNEVLLGVGGTACTDGGAGAIAEVRASGGLKTARLRLLCDVSTPFELAASTFAPQKGADPRTVSVLRKRLDRLARTLPRDPRGLPWTGAGGGLSGGLWAAFDAQLLNGIDTVLDLAGFDALLADADAVITGEGRIDTQTVGGKLIAGLSRRTSAAMVPLYAITGRCELSRLDLDRLGVSEVIEAGTPAALTWAAREITRDLAEPPCPSPPA